MDEHENIKLRPGRLSNQERFEILNEMGNIARKRYDEILDINHFGYNLEVLKGGLHFRPNVLTFENEYWVEYPTEELNLIAGYFEFGTGINNTKGPKDYIRPTQKKAMKFVAKRGGLTFAKKVRGVRPLFMFERTMSEMKNNKQSLQRKFRIEAGI